VKVFADTNVLVSAVATRGLCADVLREVISSHELVISRQVLDEVRRVLASKFGTGPEFAAEYARLLAQDAVLAEPDELPSVEISDKDDLPILAAAVAARADVLVTGDAELVGLGTVRGVRILSPRRFWELLRPRGRR
jgi:putative PIN family toxin of toxin-antitoxin system